MIIQTFPKNVQEVVDAVLGQAGHSATTLRQTVMAYAAALSRSQEPEVTPPATWQPYITTVTKHAYRVIDSDVEQLKARGHSEDEIFELTISAALGAGLARLERGLTAIEQANGGQS